MFKNFWHSRLFFFLKNICVFWRCDIYREIQENKSHLLKQNDEIRRLSFENSLLKLKDELFKYSFENKDFSLEYDDELKYLSNLNLLSVFPYNQIKHLDFVYAQMDDEKKLPYVVHKGKSLYFPSCFSLERVKEVYRNFIEVENILGGDYLKKTPHQYQSENIKVGRGDVLFDIGCAEGLFSLDVIDIVAKVYLIEADSQWIPALQATFSPYKDKVVIINKLVSNEDSESSLKLSNLLKCEEQSISLKMDIEGYETVVLKECEKVLCSRYDIKIFGCCYHKENDANEISSFLKKMNYYTEFSDGAMLFVYDKLNPPYFRKGVVRAKKI